MNKMETGLRCKIALGVVVLLCSQCSGRTQNSGSPPTYETAGASGTPVDVGGTGGTEDGEATSMGGIAIGGSTSSSAGNEHTGTDDGGTVGFVAGGSGASSFPTSPCIQPFQCGDACSQCNTLDGSCYPGTCDVIGDCTTRDPRCGGPERTCEPTDAQGTSDVRSPPCQKVFGWAWDGDKCVAVVGCQCIGSQCSSLMKDDQTCRVVYGFDFGCKK